MSLATDNAIRLAGHEGVDPAGVRHRQRPGGAGLFGAGRARARPRSGLPVRQADHARDPCRLCQEPPRHRHRLSRHRQIDPYRAGGGAAQLALRPRQSRQPHQPCRSHRQGRDRDPRRHAGDRIPRRHPALGAAAQRRAVLRRIRCRPPRRDVRDPARAGIVRPADAARPEQGDQAASGFRLFATANTVGLGDTSGLYHGTQQINQGQMDRWSIVTTLNYLPHDNEVEIVLAKAKHYRTDRRPRHRQQDGARRRSHPQRLHERRSSRRS